MRRSGFGVLVAAVLVAAALALPAGASAFAPLSSFGGFGAGAGQVDTPGGIAVAANGDVYVADLGNERVDVFNPDGSFDFAFGGAVAPGGGAACTAASGCLAGAAGEAAGEFASPASVAIAPSGDVFVADENNNRIDAFNAGGTFLFAFGRNVSPAGADVCTAASGCRAGEAGEGSGEEGSKAGGVVEPNGLTVDPGGRIYVADSGNDRIDAFGPLGEFLFALGTEVNATDFSGRCTTATGCLAGFPYEGAGGMKYPQDVKLLPSGLLAVSDGEPAITGNEGNRRVDEFTLDGEFVRAFGAEVDLPSGGDICTLECQRGLEGPRAGAVAAPAHLAVDAGGSIYIGDVALERVTEFTESGQFVRAFGAGVVNGAAAFQVCNLATGCLAGLESTVSGATPNPFGLALDCGGSVLVAEQAEGFARLERFGEPGAALPPCAAPPGTPPGLKPLPVQPSNDFKFGKVKINRKQGTATLLVKVPAAGKLLLKGAGIVRTQLKVRQPTVARLLVRASGGAKKALRKEGKARLRAKVTFTPTGGVPRTKTKKVVLKKKR